MKKLVSIIAIALCLFSCDRITAPTVQFSISLNPPTVEIEVGKTEQITATVVPADLIQSCQWSSSKPDVVAVSETGLVTGLKKGRSIITASVGTQSATCLVVVSLSPSEVVDLGLSVSWASCNVGATSPEEFGDFFSWGEVEPKEVYGWDTYKLATANDWVSMAKYSAEGLTVLDLADDAAHWYYGGKWRMPTKEEMEELIAGCTIREATINDVRGSLFTSKLNGKSIFFPLAGCKFVQNGIGPNHDLIGSSALLWSSTFNSVSQAYNMDVGVDRAIISFTTASVGYSVRAVLP